MYLIKSGKRWYIETLRSSANGREHLLHAAHLMKTVFFSIVKSIIVSLIKCVNCFAHKPIEISIFSEEYQ